jgi:hypothetical protein
MRKCQQEAVATNRLKFRLKTGQLNAEIVLILLTGLARQTDFFICYFLNLFCVHFHCLSGSDGKLASVTFS